MKYLSPDYFILTLADIIEHNKAKFLSDNSGYKSVFQIVFLVILNTLPTCHI